MQHPSLLSPETLPELKALLLEYPWFQTVRLLYVQNLVRLGEDPEGETIKALLAGLPQPERLSALMTGDEQKEKNRPQEAALPLSADKDAKTELSNKAEVHALVPFQPAAVIDYFAWLSATEAPQVPASEPAGQHQLIDSFLQKEQSHLAPSRIQPDMPPDITPPKEPEADKMTPLDASFFTETLARIYIKQKKYVQALQIIKNLSLAYPEKNIYFADQIRFLEKLIINAQK